MGLSNRKYYFNENYFQDINSEEKAYWLGFLYADGSISKINVISIALKAEDKNHLLKFLKNVNGVADQLHYNKETNSYKISLCSIIMTEQLKQYGFTTNKSYDNTDYIFSLIPNQYKKDFIRGFWDGDGYVSKNNVNQNITGVISNNNKLLISFCNYFNSFFEDATFSKVTYGDNYPRIRLKCNKAKKLCDLLYKNASIYLDRKYQNYLQLNKPKGNKNYKNIKQLKSGNYFTQFSDDNKGHITIGTFKTIKEAIEAYNKMAIQCNKPTQKYVGENLYMED